MFQENAKVLLFLYLITMTSLITVYNKWKIDASVKRTIADLLFFDRDFADKITQLCTSAYIFFNDENTNKHKTNTFYYNF